MLVSKNKFAMFGLSIMLMVLLTGCVETVIFEDKKVERIIRKEINKMSGELNQEELGYIMKLKLNSKGISSLKGLETLKNVKILELENNKITSIKPLRDLIYLEKLYLYNNSLSDISPLSNLTNLRRLYLEENNITNLTSLSKLTKLTDLDISYNPVKDITPLVNLINLNLLILPKDLPTTAENKKVIKRLRRNGTKVIE